MGVHANQPLRSQDPYYDFGRPGRQRESVKSLIPKHLPRRKVPGDSSRQPPGMLEPIPWAGWRRVKAYRQAQAR
ncbi:uncharacterized protein N7458_009906 [Penicillium daleae]|uniref:Uncharacterized protein n=1 Tax=Penicillium daleae TaxID=63821 RepID=A0AAD6BZB5_9EURO|nr:uncharacterized protein N7458_009906 [Penicillium daleae]KAJ5438908.1 hypothetical protein N7458_009906 [Penicillium daleae]